jgi:hypothetical protein
MEWLRVASSAPETRARHVDFLSVALCLLQGCLASTLRSYDNWNPFDHTAFDDQIRQATEFFVSDVIPAADNGFATRAFLCAFLSTEMRAER